MYDDGTRLEFNGTVVTGWKATVIAIVFFAVLIGLGFHAGYKMGYTASDQNACAEAA